MNKITRFSSLLKLESHITIRHILLNQDRHCLKIQMSDSSDGYHNENPNNTDEMLHARGLSMIKSFTEHISFTDNGEKMEVRYRL